jgi:hypothetical protein
VFFTWRVAAILALILSAAGFVIVRHAGPVPAAWCPPCLLHALTGLHCPGCGSTRLLHALAHGRLLTACGHNILIAISVPVLVPWGIVSLWRGLRRNQPPPHVPSGVARIVFVVVVVFTVARNLPWWPFILLAP